MSPTSVVISPINFEVLNLLFVSMQILVVQMKKKVEYFKVKWANICEKGSTWEPVEHLVGDEAKQALHLFREKRAVEAASQAEAKRARASGTDEPPLIFGQGDCNDDLADNDVDIMEPASKKARRKSSMAWKLFDHKYYDTDLKGHYAKCKTCQKPIKVVNTSNLMAHISQKHPELLVDENEKVLKVAAPILMHLGLFSFAVY
jgi:hypothetical protein